MPTSRRWFLLFAGLIYLGVLVLAKPETWMREAIGAPVSDIRATKHNFSSQATGSASGGKSGRTVPARTLYSTGTDSESQICVFCHTPHGATADTPLWNRALSGATYTPYTSTSLDASSQQEANLGQPHGSSKLCLSCHDGTLAPASVNNSPGSGSTGSINPGTGVLTKFDTSLTTDATTGFTRHIGGTAATKDLSNDHPISVTYNSTLRTNDGELRAPTGTPPSTQPMGLRSPGIRPYAPLEKTNGATTDGQVQCASCHDPHVVEQDTASFGTTNKFLRLNRFQKSAADTGDASFSVDNDISCMACHDKKGWGLSAHAVAAVAGETYDATKDINATKRQFNVGASDNTALPVWRAACLNCHDTHTVSGATRLLREGTAGALSGGMRTSGARALENTCYQCHGNSANTSYVLTSSAATLTATDGVPNIEAEFSRTRSMPILTAQQGSGGTGNEVHDITNKDFVETAANMGKNNLGNRHVECTDCHNPHRVRKGNLFTGQSTANITHDATRRTHTLGTPDGNLASGVLRGISGIEVNSMGAINAVWPQNPSTWRVVSGDPGSSTAKSSTYLTREYQLCFKCHSNYALPDDTTAAYANYPALGSTTNKTPSATNGMARYTNVAAEFLSVNATDPPTTGQDQGETNASGIEPTPTGQATSTGPGATNNHRSWHPVVWPTGRTPAERGNGSWNNLRYPYVVSGAGTMTMHCSDCHGSASTTGAGISWTQGATLTGTTGGPDLTKVQGPHGSDSNFILKGKWDTTITPSNTAGANSSNSICGRCHDPGTAVSGFAGGSEAKHSWEVKNNRYCMTCHIAVPHGWKNKAFLVNGNCIQSEAAGYTSTCTAYGGTGATSTIDLPPYYNSAKLRIESWARSGNWQKANCRDENWMSSACGI